MPHRAHEAQAAAGKHLCILVAGKESTDEQLFEFCTYSQ